MSQFNNIDMNNNTDKANKYQESDTYVNEQIDRLTEFHRALKDDTNMSYIIDTLDELHDMHISIKNQTTLLLDDLNTFKKKFTNDLNYNENEISKIKKEAIKKVEKSISTDTYVDIQKVKKSIYEIESRGVNQIQELMNRTVKNIKKNNKNILELNIEKEKYNFQGYIILGVSSVLLTITFSFLMSSVYTNKEIKRMKHTQRDYKSAIEFLKHESDERYDVIREIYRKNI